MMESPALKAMLVLLATIAIAAFVGGCSSPSAPPAAPPSGGSTATSEGAKPPVTPSPEVPPPGGTTAGAPTVSEAEAAVLKLAQSEYASIPIKTAKAAGMGTDSKGYTWIQAWTDAGTEYENEQWFAYYDGTTWKLKTYGTGLERSDLPADITWTDVP